MKLDKIIHVLAFIWVAAAAHAVEPLVIYDDATTWSCKPAEQVDLSQTEAVYSGKKAISLENLKSKSGMVLTAPKPVSCSGYDKIEFWARAIHPENGALRFKVVVNGIWPPVIREQRFLWITSDRWEKYSIPLSYLGNPTEISEISFAPDNQNAGEAIYIDDLQLATGSHDSYMPLPEYPEMIMDGGFEQGADGQYTMGCKSERVTDPVHSGKYALRVFDRPVTDTSKGLKAGAMGWTGPNYELSRYINMAGPGLYEVEVWYRAAEGTIKASVGIEAIYWDPSDNTHGKGPLPTDVKGEGKAEVGTEWTPVKFTINLQFGKMMAVLKINPVAEEGKEYFLDDISVRKLPDENAAKNPAHTIDGRIRHVPVKGTILTDISSRYSVSILGQRGSKSGEFNFPAGLTVDGKGNLLVADTDNHRIQKLDAGGGWSVIGEAGALSYPRSVAVDKNGTVFAGDSGNFRAVKLTAGKWVDVIKNDGTKPENWNQTAIRGSVTLQPVKFDQVCFGTSGLMVLDPWYGMLCAVKPDGSTEMISAYEKYIRTQGTPMPMGVSAGRMDVPMGVCADPAGTIYVADTCNHRIQKCSVSGEWSVIAGVSPDSYKCYVPEWLGSGTVPGQFYLPKAVAADAVGNLYVADSGNHRIQIFDAKSGEWTAIGKQGSGIGEFDHPSGIAVDSLGTIYISDTRNHRIVVMKVKK